MTTQQPVKNVPFLPGYQLPNVTKENFKTSQTFKVSGTAMLEQKTFKDITPADQDTIATLKLCTNSALYNTKVLGKTTNALTGLAETKAATECLQTGYQPAKPEVLRFYAYFTEPVFNSQIEDQLLRKVKIIFYMEDDTIQINEERIKNCGIPQGDFLKRQKVFKDPLNPKDYLGAEDLVIGSSLRIFQRLFTIYGADEFTCQWLAQREQNTNADAIPVPIDQFQRAMHKKNMKVNNPESKFFKEYVEVKNGGGNPNKGLEQYLANDRKVLSFQALWNDTAFAGDMNRYTINYFLADDTVEVKELQVQNSGKHPFPLLLKRAKLPKRMVMVHCPGMNHQKIEFYTQNDFVLGKMVNIFGRECLVYDCDEFTRRYYKEQFGIEQLTVPVELKTQSGTLTRVDPPYNGFGSEQDSLGNCRLLIPKPPRPDIPKMLKYDGVILRFICERITGDDNDKLASLILNFYLGDDTLSIYLTTGRNSGIIGGKFLERKRYKNKGHGDDYFTVTDFQIGAILEVNNHLMRIVSADEFTVNYMASNPEWFPLFQVPDIVKSLKTGKTKDGKNAFSALEQAMKNDTGSCSFLDLANRVREIGVQMDAQEVFAVFTKCQRNAEGDVTPKQFVEVLSKC